MSTPTALDEAMARRGLPAPAGRRHIRERAGLSQRRLGKDVGVTGQAVHLWETGAREPRGEHLVAYVTLLAQLDEITGGQA